MSYPSGYIVFVAWQSYIEGLCFKYVGLSYFVMMPSAWIQRAWSS